MGSKSRRKHRRRRGRRVNLKFTLWLLVSLLVMTAGVYRLHAFQVKRNAGIFKHQAQQAGEANRLDEASFYYGRYLKYFPADMDIVNRSTNKPINKHRPVY